MSHRNDKEVTSIFMQGWNEKYGKVGEINTSFNTLTILRERNLIVCFYD